ncbi:hypothetical protein DUI87_02036 [Hirundo rustica rustica]|uniref:ribonuclease H n=1 Tax=Hirundo rustica rustica TaxID=333673 RepID=A0A3M0L737_HIRRU|nr:hypothetical protein DUI87_02036 [Hirundo rustica rustica]
MIRELESQGVVSKTHSPFNSPIWPVRKSDGEWRLTVDYRALNEVTPPLSAAVPDMLELQYELESKAAKWYATIDIANAFFSIPLAAECRPQFAFTWRGVQYTWNRLPQGWKHSPTICHGLIQAALEKSEAPEHLQYIDDIIVWGNTAMEVFEKGEKIIQILLKAGFAIKKSKVKGPAQEIQFLGVKWHDGRRQIPTEVINKITAMCPPTNKKETQAFLGAIGFWRMHIPEYSQIVSPLYLVTRKKNDFYWGPEQQQAFAQIKQEIAHAVALSPVRTGPDVKNVLYSAAGNNGLSWSLWQKVPGETRGRPLRFWSRSYRESEANYTPTEKEILAAYKGVQTASEVVGTETQLLLAPRLPVLGWMFKAEVPSTHHATNATWSKWIALITQRAHIGNPNRPRILEIITNWPEGKNFSLMDKEEQEQVTRAEEAPPYNQLPAEETRYALFTDGSCRVVGMNQKWKAAVWSPTRQVAQATEGEAEIVDCTCRTRLKGIRCDTPPVKYRNWDSYVKRQQSCPRGPPEEYPCCREDGTPRGSRQPSRRERQRGLFSVVQEIVTPKRTSSDDLLHRLCFAKAHPAGHRTGGTSLAQEDNGNPSLQGWDVTQGAAPVDTWPCLGISVYFNTGAGLAPLPGNPQVTTVDTKDQTAPIPKRSKQPSLLSSPLEYMRRCNSHSVFSWLRLGQEEEMARNKSLGKTVVVIGIETGTTELIPFTTPVPT